MADPAQHLLSLAFMRAHPAQAAGVLEALPVDEAAALFAHAPARVGALVLTAMLPRRAAQCVDALDDTRALELLASMHTQPTVALLRHLHEPRRRHLIAGLPTAAALASTLLLGYAEDTLGAWADPDVILMPAGTRAADALDRVRLAQDPHPMVFVADADRRLSGVVALATLMRAPSNATLAGLMRRPTTLPAHTPLAGGAAHPGWEQASALPVVDPGERLVGLMTRDALARALRQAAPAAEGTDHATLPVLGARGYWQVFSGLLAGLLMLLPRVPATDDTPVLRSDPHKSPDPMGAGDTHGR